MTRRKHKSQCNGNPASERLYFSFKHLGKEREERGGLESGGGGRSTEARERPDGGLGAGVGEDKPPGAHLSPQKRGL